MFSRFFIDRPIFAAVISIFITLAGLAAMRVLPIAQYPEIAPPVVTVRAVYPGASAAVLAQTVAAPLENALNGVEDMIYMSSTSSSQRHGADPASRSRSARDVDKAAVNVNNRVKQAEPRLPDEVRRQGVTVEKSSTAFLQVLAFFSPDGSRDDLFTSNYVTLNVLDELKRLPGTTNVQIFGAKDYAMRDLAQARPAGAAAGSPPSDVVARDQRAERAVRRRQDRPGAHRRRPGARLHADHAGPPRTTRGVRGHHRAVEQRRLGAAPARRRARRARLEGLRLHRPHQRPAGDPGRHLPAARRQRARGRRERAPSACTSCRSASRRA